MDLKTEETEREDQFTYMNHVPLDDEDGAEPDAAERKRVRRMIAASVLVAVWGGVCIAAHLSHRLTQWQEFLMTLPFLAVAVIARAVLGKNDPLE